MTTTNEKLRGIFLAALMVFSVFAGTIALSGSAAAAANESASAVDDSAGTTTTFTTSGDLDDVDGASEDVESWYLNVSGADFSSVESDDITLLLDGTEYTGGTSSVATDGNGNLTAELDSPLTVSDSQNVTLVVDDFENPGTVGSSFSTNLTLEDGSDARIDSIDSSISTTSGVVVSDLDAPRVAPNQTDITVEATLTNNGDEEQTVDYTFGYDNTDDSLTDGDAEHVIASDTGVTLGAGESTTVTLTPNTTGDYNQSSTAPGYPTSVDGTHGLYVENNTDGTLVGGDDALFLVGSSPQRGAVSAEVRDTGGFPVTGANVTLYVNSVDPSNRVELANGGFNATADNGPDSNRFRWDENTATPLAIGTDTDEIDYIVRADKRQFSSDNRAASLDENNVEQTVFPELESQLDAQYIDVVRYDSEADQVLGEDATLLADNRSENTAQFAVVTQNQNDSAIRNDLEVTLTFQGVDGQGNDLALNDLIESAFDGEAPGDFTDNGLSNRTTTVTLNQSSTINVSGDNSISNSNLIRTANGSAPEGELSIATFNVTADNANETTLEDVIVTERFNATAENESTTLTTARDGYNNVTYALEGNQTISGEVEGVGDDDPITNATVWVAYDGAAQSPDAARDFAREGEDPFLIDTTDSDGRYVITGLASGAEPSDFNIYVNATGYDDENLTGVAGAYQGVVADFDLTMETNDVSQEGTTIDSDKSFILEQPPQEYDLEVFVENANGNFVKDTRVPEDETRRVRVNVTQGELDSDPDTFTPAQNQQVTLNVTETLAGNIQGANADGELEVVTNSNGNETVTFNADASFVGNVEDTNISASTENNEGTEFVTEGVGPDLNNDSDQGRFEVFTTANIEGDVVDEDQTSVPDARVTLFRINRTTSPATLEQRNQVNSTGDGSFSFTDVPTGEDYRVAAEVTIAGNTFTGFNQGQLQNLTQGTTTAGITVTGLELDNLGVSNLSAPSTVEENEQFSVTADVTNNGESEATQDVEFRLEGQTLGTETVTLQPGETQTVEFTGLSVADEGTYTHGVYTESNSQTATLTVDNSTGTGPVAQYDTNDNGTIERGELAVAAADFANGDLNRGDLGIIAANFASN